MEPGTRVHEASAFARLPLIIQPPNLYIVIVSRPTALPGHMNEPGKVDLLVTLVDCYNESRLASHINMNMYTNSHMNSNSQSYKCNTLVSHIIKRIQNMLVPRTAWAAIGK